MWADVMKINVNIESTDNSNIQSIENVIYMLKYLVERLKQQQIINIEKEKQTIKEMKERSKTVKKRKAVKPELPITLQKEECDE